MLISIRYPGSIADGRRLAWLELVVARRQLGQFRIVSLTMLVDDSVFLAI